MWEFKKVFFTLMLMVRYCTNYGLMGLYKEFVINIRKELVYEYSKF